MDSMLIVLFFIFVGISHFISDSPPVIPFQLINLQRTVHQVAWRSDQNPAV